MEIANKDTILTLRLLLGRFVLPRSNGNPRRTRNWTRRLVVAISATANSEGLGLTETAQEEQPERLRIYARILVDRHADGAETRSPRGLSADPYPTDVRNSWPLFAGCFGLPPLRFARLTSPVAGSSQLGHMKPSASTLRWPNTGFHMLHVDGSDESSSNLRVSLCDHLDGIGPTRPLRGMPALLKPSPPNFFARNPILQFAHCCPPTFSRV